MVAGTISTVEKALPVDTMEHQSTAPVVQLLRPKAERRYVVLASWACVATAVLLVVLVGGAVYVSDLKSNTGCDKSHQSSSNTEHTTKNYNRKFVDDDNTEVEEDIQVDETDQTELIVTKNKDGNIALISAIDFGRKISASYIPAASECLLLTGDDVDAVDDWGFEKTKTENISPDDLFEESYKSSGNKVTDLSILPPVMKPYCQGKATYWAEPDDGSDVQDGDRQKRFGCWIWVSQRYRCKKFLIVIWCVRKIRVGCST